MNGDMMKIKRAKAIVLIGMQLSSCFLYAPPAKRSKYLPKQAVSGHKKRPMYVPSPQLQQERPSVIVSDSNVYIKMRALILLEEMEALKLIKKALAVPDQLWDKIITNMLAIKKSVQQVTLRTPLADPYRHSRVPKELVGLIESIAIKYGIHPKSFHIHVPKKGTEEMEDDALYDAWMEPPYLFLDGSVSGSIAIGQRAPAIIFIPETFLSRFNSSDPDSLLTIHHEMMHLKELNGWGIHFVTQQLCGHGYNAAATNPKIKKELEYSEKVMERNTDLLVLLEDNTLLLKVCAVDQLRINKNPRHVNALDADTPHHFSIRLLMKWRNLLLQAHKGATYEGLLPAIKLLQTEQRSRLAGRY